MCICSYTCCVYYIYKDLNGPLTHKSGGKIPARCDFLFVSNCGFDKFLPPAFPPLFFSRTDLPAMWTTMIRMSWTRMSSWRIASSRASCTKRTKSMRRTRSGIRMRMISSWHWPTRYHTHCPISILAKLAKCLTNASCSDSPS